MDSEKKFIENSKGERIAAVIHYPDDVSTATVLLQHGLFSDKGGSWKRRANFFAEEGFTAVRFDRRGYGESDREFHEFNLSTGIEDSVTVMDYMEGEGEENFALYGSSFGGLIAIHVGAMDSRVGALGLRAPATFTDEIFSDLRNKTEGKGEIFLDEEMPGARIEMSFFEDLESYDAEEAAFGISAPTIIFHGDEDEVVPIGYSERFYDLLGVEKKFLKLDGEGHVFSLEKDQKALRKAADWFSKHLK